jgi:hypothetical protein
MILIDLLARDAELRRVVGKWRRDVAELDAIGRS